MPALGHSARRFGHLSHTCANWRPVLLAAIHARRLVVLIRMQRTSRQQASVCLLAGTVVHKRLHPRRRTPTRFTADYGRVRKIGRPIL